MRIAVLCYHGISSTWATSPTAISVETFTAQIERFLSDGYRGATFTEAVLDPPAERTLAVTFDDGYRSILEVAPVLDRLGVPATLFVPTDRLGRGELLAWPDLDRFLGTEHEHELEPMTWDEISGLADAGWEIGAHTVTHPHLPLVDDETLAAELVGSKAECEARLGRPCTSLAYPFGDADTRVIAAVRRAGFSAAAGLRAKKRQNLQWPRICVSARDTAEGLFARAESVEVAPRS